MGFRVPGKVAKRLVEVGQTVDVGQPLATLDEVDLKLQAEQAEAEFRAATGVLAQAGAAEQRAKDLRAKGWTTDAALDTSKAAPMKRVRGSIAPSAQSKLTKNSLSYATLDADTRGVVTATLVEPGQGRGLRPDRDPRRPPWREGSRRRDPRDAGRTAPSPAQPP